jgi:hypothetical protein
LEFTPEDIVGKLSEEILRGLEERLEDDYLKSAQLKDEMRSCFWRLRFAMDRILDELIENPDQRERYKALLHRIAGDTALEMYYGDKPNSKRNSDIGHWSLTVIRHVSKSVLNDPDMMPFLDGFI